MYAAVRRYEGVTDPAEVARVAREGFLPIVSQVPGFVAFYWIDAGNGVVVSTSVFQDRAGAEESNLRASNFIRDSLGAYLPHPPEITAGEVLVTA